MATTVSAGRPEDLDGLEPPPWELPGIVLIEQTVTRSDEVVMSAGQFRIFSTGAFVTFEVRLGNGREDDPDYTEDLYWLLSTRGRLPTPVGPTLGLRTPGDPAATSTLMQSFRPNLDMRAGAAADPSGGSPTGCPPTPLEDVAFIGAWPWPARGIPAGEAVISGEQLRTWHDVIQRL